MRLVKFVAKRSANEEQEDMTNLPITIKARFGLRGGLCLAAPQHLKRSKRKKVSLVERIEC